MKTIRLKSTSLVTAEVDALVLREGPQIRLLFVPKLVNNQGSPLASAKGTFAYQKKARADTWENHATLPLNQLRKDEWVKLALSTSETLGLFEELRRLYELHAKQGIPRGEHEFVEVEPDAAKMLSSVRSLLSNAQDPSIIPIACDVLRWLSDSSEPARAAKALESIPADALAGVHCAVGAAALRAVHSEWESSSKEELEPHWQKLLADNAFVLSQLFSQPVIVIQWEAYVGGKRAANTHGNLVDFLCASEIGRCAILVEIKKPSTRLLGSEYRTGVYPPSTELAGAMQQATAYKHSLSEEARIVLQGLRIGAFEPRPIVIAGMTSEFADDSDKVKSFELYRRQQRDVEVVTFDELFLKTSRLLELLEGAADVAT